MADDFDTTEISMDQPPRFRIGKTEGKLMIIVALFYDSLQIILVWLFIGFLFNWIISIFAFLTFFVWFKIRGVGLFWDKQFVKRVLPRLALLLFDMVPGSSASIVLGFTWTLTIWFAVITTRIDDRHNTKTFENIIEGVTRYATGQYERDPEDGAEINTRPTWRGIPHQTIRTPRRPRNVVGDEIEQQPRYAA